VNRVKRFLLTWKHKRKFARTGRDCIYPIQDLTIEGHVEQGDIGRFRNNATFRAFGTGKIIFGTRSGTSWGCVIEANELVQIGDYTGIAEYTTITDTAWQFAGTTGSWREVPRRTSPVHIGAACFIGSGCFIGPGVTIGDGAVIANHSYVTRDVGPYEIWAGAPARFVAHRTQNIPESRQRQFDELVAQQGIQEDRYKE